MTDQPPTGAGEASGPPTVFGDQPPIPEAQPTVTVPPQPAPEPTGGGPQGPGGPGGPGGYGPDDEPEPWYNNPAAVAVLVVLGIIVLILLFLVLTNGDDGEPTDTTVSTTTTTTTTPTTSSTTSTTTTTTTSTTTSTTTTTTTTTVPPIQPGDPCSPEEGLPDCVDPDGDGNFTYLTGGADCIAANPGNEIVCDDTDGDGIAGSFQDGD